MAAYGKWKNKPSGGRRRQYDYLLLAGEAEGCSEAQLDTDSFRQEWVPLLRLNIPLESFIGTS